MSRFFHNPSADKADGLREQHKCANILKGDIDASKRESWIMIHTRHGLDIKGGISTFFNNVKVRFKSVQVIQHLPIGLGGIPLADGLLQFVLQCRQLFPEVTVEGLGLARQTDVFCWVQNNVKKNKNLNCE